MADDPNPFQRKDFKGEIVEEYSGLTEDEADRAVLDELRTRGSDLSLRLHPVSAKTLQLLCSSTVTGQLFLRGTKRTVKSCP